MGALVRWLKKPCDACGAEGYASRTEPVDEDAPYLCGECEVHASYDGLRAERDAMRDVVEAARACARTWSHPFHSHGLSADSRPALLVLKALKALKALDALDATPTEEAGDGE